ncbi:unnamed protein product [Mytilus coruscus]|uniref:Uncharacterized protein n=1 Tax=Mytilus coruscus TaxID=42192 RepID=A0A6J8BNK0_MYTCO|nr:unnamed protein product [Mytilus coruscus]
MNISEITLFGKSFKRTNNVGLSTELCVIPMITFLQLDLDPLTCTTIETVFNIGLSHLVRSYRKRSAVNVIRGSLGDEIAIRQEMVEQPYIEIYNEIDEQLVVEDNNESRLTLLFRNSSATLNNEINSSHDNRSSYLDPYFEVAEPKNHSSLKESDSSYSSNFGLVNPDNTGYLNHRENLKNHSKFFCLLGCSDFTEK